MIEITEAGGVMMRGPLIETSARAILNQGIQIGIKSVQQAKSQGIDEMKKRIALRMLKKVNCR